MRSVMMLCGVLLATIASAEEQEPSSRSEARRTFVGLVPMPLRESVVGIDGEQVLGPKLSAQLGVRLGMAVGKTSGDNPGFDSSRFQLGFQPGLRYYLTGTALDGLWVGSHLELSGQQLENASSLPDGRVTNRDRTWRLGVAALAGYSMVVARGLTIQAGVGVGAEHAWGGLTMVSSSLSGETQEIQFDVRQWGISERVTLAVGWAF
jgi:hypothetical protein